MYHYIDDKEFLQRMRRRCSDIVNQLVTAINNDDLMTVKAHLVGSGAKNLETQNASAPIDLDYNLVVINSSCPINDGKQIKNYIMKKFNMILKKNGWSDCSDSTSCLETETREFKSGNKTGFSIDLAIVYEDPDGTWYRLIHEKTGNISNDRWFWNIGPNSKGLTKKVDWLKNKNLWNEVREVYLEKKNMYLKGNDHNHPSFICYIETINELYNKHK
ncbi:MAG: hypothetical protein J1F68_00055 [Clostridiales bacterium]|nr:hypothetical protein [Clostridiales bacterium]